MHRALARTGTPALLVATAVLVCSPLTAGEDGREFEIVLDTGSVPLGAYTLTLVYDPGRVRIASIDGGRTTAFGGRPVRNPASFSSGRTTLSAFQTTSLGQPAGAVSVARVTVAGQRLEGDLRRRRAQRAPFRVEVDVAADTAGAALRPRVEVRPVGTGLPADGRRGR